MSFFGLIFFLIIIFFVVRPLLQVWLRVRNARRRFNDMMNGTGDFAYTRRRPAAGTDGYASSRQRNPSRRKKIPDDTGEYVAFEELSCNIKSTGNNDDAAGRTTFEREQQIVDAEWEEIRK